MDIDVKNAYSKVLVSCNTSLQDLFVNDIYRFIKCISKENAEERFSEFCNIYIRKKYNTDKWKDLDKNFFIPMMFKHVDITSTIVADEISFFTVLGKYYLFSKFDREDIDQKKCRDALLQINSFSKVESDTSVVQSKKKIDVKENTEHAKEIEQQEEENVDEPEETLEELLDKLHSLIGLNGVKEEVDQMIRLIQLQKKAEEFGEKNISLSLHLVFYGNPGTGKTTVSRLIAKIYKSLGVLSKGQLVETDRGGLVGGYVGQTAIKTQEMIDKAMGGILFIDEAYALTHGKGENDFGQEAVDTILKAMEDHRDDFIVIVAGYPELMKEFIASNPGLKSRFNQYINFEDYTPNELKEIFLLYCKNQNLILGENCDEYLIHHFQELYDNRSEDYANGRDVRNYFEKVIKMRANRLSPNLNAITLDDFRTIALSDLKNASNMKNSEW